MMFQVSADPSAWHRTFGDRKCRCDFNASSSRRVSGTYRSRPPFGVERDGRKLDDVASPRHRALDLFVCVSQLLIGILGCLLLPLREKRQIDDDESVDCEQQRLKHRLRRCVPGGRHKCKGDDRKADQERANRRPDACKKADDENRHREQSEWSTCFSKRCEPYPERQRARYGGNGEEISDDRALERMWV
jgi:hypothetical protein